MMVRFAPLSVLLLLAACDDPVSEPVVSAEAAANGVIEAATPTPPAADRGDGAAALARISGGATSFVRAGDGWRPALVVCDGTDRPGAYALEADGALTMLPPGGAPIARAVTLGAAEPGAGQIYVPFTIAGGGEGNVHAFNPGMVEGAMTPTIAAVTVAGAATRCRWQPRTRFLGVTARRSVLVTGSADDSIVYRSFDHAAFGRLRPFDNGRTTTASLTVTGGAADEAETGARWTFENAGVGYRIDVARGGAATLTVLRRGRPPVSEPFLAYTIASATPPAPDRVTARYACEDGAGFTVLFDNRANSAELRGDAGRPVQLQGQPTGSGIHYAGGGVDLRGKGPEAIITDAAGEHRCREGG